MGSFWKRLFGDGKDKETEQNVVEITRNQPETTAEEKVENATPSGPYLPYEQDGKTYNLYEMPDGFVITGNVVLTSKCLTELPDLSNVTVKGDFWCEYNNLTTLKGAPQKIGGGFYCGNNQLTTLEGAPREVGGNFWCQRNKLISLEGAPQKIAGEFNCFDNQLTTLEGMPQELGGNLWCNQNPLKSLEWLPQMKAGAEMFCDYGLVAKYGFGRSSGNSSCSRFKAEELYRNPRYIAEFGNEDRITMLRQKIADGKELSRSEEQVLEQEKHRSGYAAFKKKMAKEREE